MIAVCKKYKKLFPDVDIVLRQKTFPDYFPAFLAGDFDVTTDYVFSFAGNILDKPGIEVLKINPYHMDICVSSSDPINTLKKASIENLRNRKLMMHSRGLSKADDLVRDYLETHEPKIEIVDFPYFSHEIIAKAAMEDLLMICVRQYCLNIPHFSAVPMDWDFPVERGILYKKNPRPEVKNFIDLIKQTKNENDL